MSVCSYALAQPQGGVAGPNNGFLALDATHIYFSYQGNPAPGGVAMVNKDGTNPSCVECDVGTPRTLVTDSTSVYWIDTGLNQVKKAPLGGTSATQIGSAGSLGVWGIAVDQNYVYWADTAANNLMQADLDGSNPTALVSGETNMGSMAADGTTVFWTNGNDIRAQSLTGGGPTTLAPGGTNPKSLAVDSTHVYWAEGAWNAPQNTVRRVVKTGGTPEILATHTGAWAIALDPSHVYVAGSGQDPTDNEIWRVPKAGGTPEILATDQLYPFDIEVDDVAVYWSSEQDGAVYKMPK